MDLREHVEHMSRPVRRRRGWAAGKGGEPAGAPEESGNVPAALRNFHCSNEKHAEYLFSNNSRKTTHILEVMLHIHERNILHLTRPIVSKINGNHLFFCWRACAAGNDSLQPESLALRRKIVMICFYFLELI